MKTTTNLETDGYFPLLITEGNSYTIYSFYLFFPPVLNCTACVTEVCGSLPTCADVYGITNRYPNFLSNRHSNQTGPVANGAGFSSDDEDSDQKRNLV